MGNTTCTDRAFARAAETIRQAEDWLFEHGSTFGSHWQGQQWQVRSFRRRMERLVEVESGLGSIGMFGASQSGKSYVIGTLGAEKGKPFKVMLGKEAVEFVGTINPPGGEESTGLVTRFTFHQLPEPLHADFPVRLVLLNESDVVRVIINTYLEDINRNMVGAEEPGVGDMVSWLAGYSGSSTAARGMSKDAILDVRDYLRLHFNNHARKFHEDYWKWLLDKLPCLDGDARVRALSPLWGQVSEFSNLYKLLREALLSLDFSEVVYAKSEPTLLPSDSSILKVSTLECLGSETDNSPVLEVMTEGQKKVNIRGSVLSGLGKELVLQAENKPPDLPFLEYADLLDFPGARSRLKKTLQELANDVKISDFFLRGKVNYLFQSYVEARGLNAMFLCVGPDLQDVRTLPAEVTHWVHEFYGQDNQARSNPGGQPPLFITLTKLDETLKEKPGQTTAQRWNARIKSSLIEQFGNLEWFKTWHGTQPFQNILGFRNNKSYPSKEIFKYDENKNEIGPLNTEREQWLQEQKGYFVQQDTVMTNVRDAGETWDGCMHPDGGVSYLAQRLQDDFTSTTKAEQLLSIATTILRQTVKRLGSYYVSGDIDKEFEKKKDILSELGSGLNKCLSNNRIGTFFEGMTPTEEKSFQLLLQADKAPELLRADSRGSAESQANSVLANWGNSLTSRVEDRKFLEQHNLSPEALQLVVDEIMQATERLHIRKQLSNAIYEVFVYDRASDKTRNWRSKICSELMSRFLRDLGMADLNPPEVPHRQQNDTVKVFQDVQDFDDLPDLAEDRDSHEQTYVADWLAAFEKVIKLNLEQRGDESFNVEANRALGGIIKELNLIAEQIESPPGTGLDAEADQKRQ